MESQHLILQFYQILSPQSMYTRYYSKTKLLLTNSLHDVEAVDLSSLKIVTQLHTSLEFDLQWLFTKLITQLKHSSKLSLRNTLYKMLCAFKAIAHENMRQQTPLYSTKGRSLILIPMETKNSFLESLQGKEQPLQISAPKTKSTMRNLSKSNRLSLERRIPIKGEGR